MKKKYDIRIGVWMRFIRTFLPQMVVAMPIITAFVMDNQQYMPLWVLPVVGFVGSVVTSADKLRRELGKAK